jgi:uncharacterized protein (TIGR02271 family)
MTDERQQAPDLPADRDDISPAAKEQVLPLAEEHVRVEKRPYERGRVRVRTVVRDETCTIEEPLHQTDVVVDRVAVERFVSEPVPDRQVGDTLIVSLHREVIVYERRLQVYEELHINRKSRQEQHRETLAVRREEATIERIEPDGTPQA